MIGEFQAPKQQPCCSNALISPVFSNRQAAGLHLISPHGTPVAGPSFEALRGTSATVLLRFAPWGSSFENSVDHDDEFPH
ncbi:hypothetical protein, partial [Rhizobium aethiopicum]|uniref:hypothetical protein n=2 Tax=Rhizobium TaxID=379 RepID=UPI001AEE1D30